MSAETPATEPDSRGLLQDFTERGLWFPTMLALGLATMVLWNIFFVYKALETAPEVRSDYTHAIER